MIRTALSMALALVATRAAAQSCIPISSVPYTISAQGSYCLTANPTYLPLTGAAITVTASSVTLDLGAFKLAGNSNPATTAVGVLVQGQRNVTIRGGSIRRIHRGIVFEDSSGTAQENLVDDVQFGLVTGVAVEMSGQGIVRRIRVAGSGPGSTTANVYGIVASGSVSVIDSHISGLVPGVGGEAVGIQVRSGSALLRGNYLSQLPKGIAFLAGAIGKYRDTLTIDVAAPFSGGTDAGNNN